MTGPFLSSEETEKQMEEIQRQLRGAFTRFVGSPVGDTVRRMIEHISRDILLLSSAPPMQDLMVGLGMVAVGCGCPRKVCEMLKALNSMDLEFLYEHCGYGPGNMIWLEWAARRGDIRSWGTDQETMEDGELHLVFEPKKPVNFIKIDLTLENKS